MHSKSQNNTNHPSLLLNQQQNNLVFSLLGKRCYTLATAVVQLVLTEPTSLNEWSLKATGVVCFVKDHPKKSYFIKVYDCDNRRLTWQQEIYPSFEYKTPRPYFHTFEAHDCIVGLNFASEQEAQIFKETILGKLRDRERRTDRLRAAHINGNGQSTSHIKSINLLSSNGQYHRNNDDNLSITSAPTPATNHNHLNGVSHGLTSTHEHSANNQYRLPHTVSARMQPTQTGAAASIPISTMQKSQSALLGNGMSNINLSMSANIIKSEKKKLNKRDIGLPTNFQHVTHVGFSPQTGFDLDNVNPSMKKDLQLLFDNSSENQQTTATQPPPVDPPPRPPPPPRPLPPMPSSARKDNNQAAPQSPPVPPPPPPPPPPFPPIVSAATPPKPPPMPSTPLVANPPRPPPLPTTPLGSAIPKPPPPPPMPLTGGPPKPPPPPPAPLIGGSPRQPQPDLNAHAALMSQVLQGKQLNRVETRQVPPTAPLGHTDDPRSALMNQIKAGVKLRSTNKNKPGKPEAVAPPVGLAGALAKALQERGKVLHHSSSENEEDADEWDE